MICVLDLESKPDPTALGLAGGVANDRRSGLFAISAASVLLAREIPDGTWCDFQLQSFGQPDGEADILLGLDEMLAPLRKSRPMLVTYNGRRHDLGLIRRRQSRHWLFGLPGLEAVQSWRHCDVMLEQDRGWRHSMPSLNDACAGLGFSAAASVAPPKGVLLDRSIRKSQVDVAATFLLHLFGEARRRGRPDVLVAGWSGLATFVEGRRDAHLQQFRHNDMLLAHVGLTASMSHDDGEPPHS